MPARRTAPATADSPGAPGSDIAALYGSPLGEFTAARNALAGRLRKAGERDAAAEVQALVKPTPAAWAVNQLLRRERAAFDALLAAGERARAALGRTLTGAGPEVVREALAEMRQRREQLLRRGADLLAGDGRAASPTQLERLAVNLEAMALSPAAQEAVQRGWLDRDLDPPGFEVLAGLQLAALPPRSPASAPSARKEPEPAPARREPARTPAPGPAGRREEKAAREREQREEARRRERQARLQEKVDQRAREAEELEVQAGTAEHEAKVAESDARQAERAAAEARRRADQAREAAGRARERAARAAERLAQAQSDLAAAP